MAISDHCWFSVVNWKVGCSKQTASATTSVHTIRHSLQKLILEKCSWEVCGKYKDEKLFGYLHANKFSVNGHMFVGSRMLLLAISERFTCDDVMTSVHFTQNRQRASHSEQDGGGQDEQG